MGDTGLAVGRQGPSVAGGGPCCPHPRHPRTQPTCSKRQPSDMVETICVSSSSWHCSTRYTCLGGTCGQETPWRAPGEAPPAPPGTCPRRLVGEEERWTEPCLSTFSGPGAQHVMALFRHPCIKGGRARTGAQRAQEGRRAARGGHSGSSNEPDPQETRSLPTSVPGAGRWPPPVPSPMLPLPQTEAWGPSSGTPAPVARTVPTEDCLTQVGTG